MSDSAPDNPAAATLPTFSERLSNWLGFKINFPAVPLPQTAKNLDKAAASILLAIGDNAASRIERNTSQQRAKAAMEAQIIGAAGSRLIEQIKSGVSTELTDRALEFSLSDSVSKQLNREKILRLAIEDLGSKTSEQTADAASEIDDDWLNYFRDSASNKTNDEIQALWAKILSGKIRNPSSFSLHSLQLLSAIDTNDANAIHNLLSLVINRSFIFKTFEDLSEMLICETLGVITGASGALSSINTPTQAMIDNNISTSAHFVMVGSHVFAQFNAPIRLEIPCIYLTRFGRELFMLSNEFERDEKYEQQFIDFLKGRGASVKRAIVKRGETAHVLVDV